MIENYKWGGGGGGGFRKAIFSKETIQLNWKFHWGGGGGGTNQKTFQRVGMDIVDNLRLVCFPEIITGTIQEKIKGQVD